MYLYLSSRIVLTLFSSPIKIAQRRRKTAGGRRKPRSSLQKWYRGWSWTANVKPATAGRGAGPHALFEIGPLQPAGALFVDFALLDLLAIDENGERRKTLVLAAAGSRD